MTIIIEKLIKFVKDVFKTNLEVFLDALKLSPNAQGYVAGSVTELLLKRKLENDFNFEVKRIKEKWEGRKHPNHHGDFYIRDQSSDRWFVLESKGIKSNSEKWHKLYNHSNLTKMLYSNYDIIDFMDKSIPQEASIRKWIQTYLPLYLTIYNTDLYDYEEIQNYSSNPPKKATIKSAAISVLKDLTRDQVNQLINERLDYLATRLRVLETHFVSGQSKSSDRTQATPRKDEFNLISVDICLKYDDHYFLFANPKHLDSSTSDPNHLQQNYVIGFIHNTNTGNRLCVDEQWSSDFYEVFESLSENEAVSIDEMQIDNRHEIVYED